MPFSYYRSSFRGSIRVGCAVHPVSVDECEAPFREVGDEDAAFVIPAYFSGYGEWEEGSVEKGTDAVDFPAEALGVVLVSR